MNEDIIGQTATLTAEELIVFAASRDLAPPPGVLPVIKQLNDSAAREEILSFAARALVSRGASLRVAKIGGRPSAIDTLLTLLCEPAGRVVVLSGAISLTESYSFALHGDVGVVQAWNELNLHAVRGCRGAEVMPAINVAAQVDRVGLRDCDVELVIDAEDHDKAVRAGRGAVEEVVRTLATGHLTIDVIASLTATLSGESPGTVIVFDRIKDHSHASAYAWFDPGPTGAWMVEHTALTGSKMNDSKLRVTRVGGKELVSLIVDRCEMTNRDGNKN